MIVTIPLIFAICVYVKDVSSASFSKVFVQNGHEYPNEYFQYGAPSVSYSPQIAHLTAAPVGSVVPYASNYVPCGSPCIYPGQVASIAPSANVVQYQSPSLPVVVAPSRSDPSRGYEYSYIVYDDQTGDHKAQRELSDGSVVRGGYTFLQPDGLVREVQYVADDLQGFNAVVRNYVPTSVESKKHEHAHKTEPEQAPCHEEKKEHQAHHEGQHEEHHGPEELHEEHGHESHHAKPTHEDLKAHDHDAPHEHKEPEHHESHDKHHEPEHGDHHEEHHKENHETQEEHHEPENVEHHEKQHETNEENHDPHGEHLEALVEHHEPNDHSHETPAEHEGHATPHEHNDHEEHEGHVEHVELPAEAIHEEPAHEHETAHADHTEPEAHETHEHHIAMVDPTIDNGNILVSYNDIIKCIQAAINGVNEVSPHKQESPLTYIILNKPC